MPSDMNSKIRLLLDRLYESASKKETIHPLLKDTLERTNNDKEKAISYLSENLSGVSESMNFISALAQNLSFTLAVEQFGHTIFKEMKILIAILALRGHDGNNPSTKELIISLLTDPRDSSILQKIIKGDG